MENEKLKIKPIETSKGLKVINVPRRALESVTGQIKCVCDNCLGSPDYGYYVAVLNRWLCPTCYARWIATAKWYAEDAWVENKNYERYMNLLRGW